MKTIKLSESKTEATRSGQYNPSPAERQRLRALREAAKRAGIPYNVRDNSPKTTAKKTTKKSASQDHGNSG